MRVLIACEKSQVICKAFREKGHNAYSCDILPAEGGHPEWHILDDVMNVIDEKWDLMIGHPECRYLCFSGERWIKEIPGRYELRLKAFDFLKKLYNAPINRIAIENSHSVFLEKEFMKPDQKVHPYHFGDPFKKMHCLWLKNLPHLNYTNILPEEQRNPACWLMPPGKDRSAIRAKSYPGIANAMADQWGNLNL